MPILLAPPDVDRMLCYPRGPSKRLAKRGQIPHVRLPDGEIRFDPEVIERWLRECAAAGMPGRRAWNVRRALPVAARILVKTLILAMTLWALAVSARQNSPFAVVVLANLLWRLVERWIPRDPRCLLAAPSQTARSRNVNLPASPASASRRSVGSKRASTRRPSTRLSGRFRACRAGSRVRESHAGSSRGAKSRRDRRTSLPAFLARPHPTAAQWDALQ